MTTLKAPPRPEGIYSFEYLRALFDDMAGSYDRVNYLTSFGFSVRFRRQFIERAAVREGDAVCDLMCGGGECWSLVLDRIGGGGRLVAIDLSPGMLALARKRLPRHAGRDVVVMEGNALDTGLPDDSMDRVLVGFGLKTLAPELAGALGAEVRRILRPGGVASLVEMSDPRGWALRPLFMAYLKRIVPILGRLLLGNPDSYRMLGVYTERFAGCEPIADAFRAAGLETEVVRYFHGCATGIVARKPHTKTQRAQR